MKLGILTATTLLISPGLAVPALAQRACIVDNNNNVVCGRPATDLEIQQYNSSSSGSQRENLYKSINDIYRDVLGQDVSRNEFLRWSRAVERGQSIKDVRREVAQSLEAQAKINQMQDVSTVILASTHTQPSS